MSLENFTTQKTILQRKNSTESQRKRISHYSYRLSDCLSVNKGISVYRGNNDLRNEPVIIKVIPNTNVERKSQIQNEMYVANLVKHHNIMEMHDLLMTNNNHYEVQQYCENSLDKLMAFRKLSETQCLKYFKELVQGYQFLRKNNILHRNLTPQSIFIIQGDIKISGFKYSVKSNDEQEGAQEKRIFMKSLIQENRQYYSPQTIVSIKYTQKSDIWSLGIILYQMLTNKKLYKSYSELLKLQHTISQQLDKFQVQSPLIQRLLRRCLSFDQSKRANIQQLKQLLSTNNLIQPKNNKDFSNINASNNNSNKQSLIIQIAKDKVILNELRYIQFLQKLQRLMNKCANIKFSENLLFLFKFMIKMRLSVIKIQLQSNAFDIKDWENLPKSQKYDQVMNQYKGFMERYDRQLKYNNQPYEKRIELLKGKSYGYNEYLVLQFQAILRQYIIELYQQLSNLLTEQDVFIHESEILFLDFLITQFQLTSITIQNDNNPLIFMKESYLQQILENPVVIDLSVYGYIKNKFHDLQFQQKL